MGEIDEEQIVGTKQQERIRKQALARARNYGGFLGAWTETAKLTFPNVYIFGTDNSPGTGLRETFVVVVSMKPLDLKDLGSRADDPKFYSKSTRTEPVPYGPDDAKAVTVRSRNIILTDDYAPVDNLLGPVAEIVVIDGARRLGGALRTVELAGLALDVGAEAFLMRRPISSHQSSSGRLHSYSYASITTSADACKAELSDCRSQHR